MLKAKNKIGKNFFLAVIVSSVSCLLLLNNGCKMSKSLVKPLQGKIKLITLDPGHFHAALVQKQMYQEVDSVVNVYAPEGIELKSHLALITKYNSLPNQPTHWKEEVYTGADYLEKMLSQKKGNVVVIAGNNSRKTEYITKSVESGYNVLADKPMAIDPQGFIKLEAAYQKAKENGVLLYDVMTERYEINSILQREFSQQKEIFGELVKGTIENPAITKESVHHFFKYVSGSPLFRPAWYYDVKQQAEGLVDVTTHLVDLVQWECFPEQIINYKTDVKMLNANRWATPITLAQYQLSTGQNSFPSYLQSAIKDQVLQVFANGEMNYTLKGVHAKVAVKWDFQAPEGTGDTHFSTIRGTKANVIIRQGKEQQYKPMLYIEPVAGQQNFEPILAQTIKNLQAKYPGLGYQKVNSSWQILVPNQFNVGHEEHFAQVTKAYLNYLKQGALPKWEVPNILAKYYTTTQALAKAETVKR